MSDDDTSQPSDTMRGRVQESRWKIWLLMDAPRWAVAGVVVAGVFLALTVFSALGLTPLRITVRDHNATWWLFSPMVGAIVTGVTLVVTINQLVISQELGPLGDQRERMQGAIDFREDVGAFLDTEISPPEPASFLGAIVDGIQTYANRLEEAVADCTDDELREYTDEYVDGLTDQATVVGNKLEGAQFGTFDVLFAALDFNYSWKIYEAQRLRRTHEDSLDDEADEAFETLIEVLEFFGPAREHVKTLYFQWELVDLSRVILYASVPALVVTFGMLLYVDTGTFTGVTLGIDDLAWVVNAAAALTLTPFAVLLSYILRIGTVAKRTLAIGPFILRETDQSSDIDWDE
ncbi:hypothetical protein ACFQPA_00695 [Halomarina halobia]|uniref:DUF4239 domain-containing protein n=1 Tax=Halomarina halobia TaxID=3033386 RepID=A0ABD6A854_9EURY|nr:hypothetical protein [Halomarina sp. PSR21]